MIEKLRHLVGRPSASAPGSNQATRPSLTAEGSRPLRGIYTLANDGVLDSALALFESLACFAPGLPVKVIPYDERQDLLAPVVRGFGHSYFDSPEIARLHRLGCSFYPAHDFSARGFRKLAAFGGPFENFLFLDSDVVALSPVEPLLEAIAVAGADLVHFDTDLDQVYRPGELRDRLVARGARGFNSGLFGGRRGSITPESIAASLHTLAADWSTQLVPTAEQSFLNYHVDLAGLQVRAAHELLADHCSTTWPAVGRIEFDGEAYRLRESGRWDEGWQMYFAHWAGFPLGPEMPNRKLFEHFHSGARKRLARIDSAASHA